MADPHVIHCASCKLDNDVEYGNIEWGKKIGEGSFSIVFRGKYQGVDVAIKQIKIEEVKDEVIEDFRHEVTVMRFLGDSHPNIAKYIGACHYHVGDVNELCILFEFLGCTLEEKFTKKPLTWMEYLTCAEGIVRGLQFIHARGLLHRDLKPANLLMDATGSIKLADFGLAQRLECSAEEYETHEGAYGATGTPTYMAPEAIRQEKYGLKADIFAVGVILCEMITRKYPYAGFEDISTSAFEAAIVAGVRPPLTTLLGVDIPQPLSETIIRCWGDDASKRPTLNEMLDTILALQQPRTAAGSPTSTAINPLTTRPRGRPIRASSSYFPLFGIADPSTLPTTCPQLKEFLQSRKRALAAEKKEKKRRKARGLEPSSDEKAEESPSSNSSYVASESDSDGDRSSSTSDSDSDSGSDEDDEEMSAERIAQMEAEEADTLKRIAEYSRLPSAAAPTPTVRTRSSALHHRLPVRLLKRALPDGGHRWSVVPQDFSEKIRLSRTGRTWRVVHPPRERRNGPRMLISIQRATDTVTGLPAWSVKSSSTAVDSDSAPLSNLLTSPPPPPSSYNSSASSSSSMLSSPLPAASLLSEFNEVAAASAPAAAAAAASEPSISYSLDSLAQLAVPRHKHHHEHHHKHHHEHHHEHHHALEGTPRKRKTLETFGPRELHGWVRDVHTDPLRIRLVRRTPHIEPMSLDSAAQCMPPTDAQLPSGVDEPPVPPPVTLIPAAAVGLDALAGLAASMSPSVGNTAADSTAASSSSASVPYTSLLPSLSSHSSFEVPAAPQAAATSAPSATPFSAPIATGASVPSGPSQPLLLSSSQASFAPQPLPSGPPPHSSLPPLPPLPPILPEQTIPPLSSLPQTSSASSGTGSASSPRFWGLGQLLPTFSWPSTPKTAETVPSASSSSSSSNPFASTSSPSAASSSPALITPTTATVTIPELSSSSPSSLASGRAVPLLLADSAAPRRTSDLSASYSIPPSPSELSASFSHPQFIDALHNPHAVGSGLQQNHSPMSLGSESMSNGLYAQHTPAHSALLPSPSSYPPSNSSLSTYGVTHALSRTPSPRGQAPFVSPLTWSPAQTQMPPSIVHDDS